MMRTSKSFFRTFAAVALASGVVLAQDQPPAPPQQAPSSNGGWRRVGDPPPVAPTPQASSAPAQTDPTEPVDRSDAYGQQPQSVEPQATPQQTTPPALQRRTTPEAQTRRPAYGIPPELTLKQGTFFTVRINQMLASNKSRSGDLFTATLTQPLLVNGIVVAEPGQTVAGTVSDTGKTKEGKHFIRLNLTTITAADGTQVPVHTQLAAIVGGTTPAGIQAGTVIGTTATGAAIGGIAAWGTGAAIGAGAGAAVGLAAIFATRDRPAVIYPETALTFQITSPVTVSTVNAPQAFRYAGPYDTQQQPTMLRAQPRPYPGAGYPGAGYGAAYAAPGYGYPGYGYPPAYYGPGYYPYAYPYYGPGFGVVIGRGGWGRGWGRRW
jgi:hypothetical protein